MTAKKSLTTKKTHRSINYRGHLIDPNQFFDRDISWLRFNNRVLHQAMDQRTPLLERLRFCEIYVSNMDEFFMKRIGHLIQKIKHGDNRPSINGMLPGCLVEDLRGLIVDQTNTFEKHFETSLMQDLKNNNICILKWGSLSQSETTLLNLYFDKNIYPILTPLAVDSGTPFPFISNLSTSLAVCLRKPKKKKRHFARVKIPKETAQWIKLPSTKSSNQRFVHITEVVRHNLSKLFSGMEIESQLLFRITRSAATEDDNEDVEDLMEYIEEEIRERKFAPLVRIEHEKPQKPWPLDFLKSELNVTENELYEIDSIARLTSFSGLYKKIAAPHLKYGHLQARPIREFTLKSATQNFPVFKSISKKDFLFHFPYESYQCSVEEFIAQAAQDPDVMAIKLVLYRTDTTGNLIKKLIFAAESGKQVACIIELKARFDEEKNIRWAQTLEEAGVHVSYGLQDLKVHAKMALVVRRESNELKCYANIGTGNFNAQTSKFYTDLSFFTSKKQITSEIVELFNHLTGRTLKKRYKHLLVAPFNMHSRFISMIENEISMHKKFKRGHIIAKMNQLEEPLLIEALYRASQSGVKVDLIVRGFCCLRPGIKGLSENIRVTSIVGQLLEHSRVFYFSKCEKDPLEADFFIGSADWMTRNQFKRVEVVTALTQKECRRKVWSMLQLMLKDNRNAWTLLENGQYRQKKSRKGQSEFNSQKILMGQ